MEPAGNIAKAIPPPVLKLSQNVINGMIPIEIYNLKKYAFDPSYSVFFSLSYKFGDSIWEPKPISWSNINDHNKFWLKVPLFTTPYSIEINMTAKICKIDTIKRKIINISHSKSITYTANIPTILIETTHKKGDKIQYAEPGAGYVSSGVIMEIMENDMIKIRKSDGTKKIFYCHASKVYRDAIDAQYVVDITDQSKPETDLMLRTEDMNKQNVYYAMRRALWHNYLRKIGPEWVVSHVGDVVFMGNLIAMNIYEFMHAPEYEYRVQCLFDSKRLFNDKQWRYHILRNYNYIKKGMRMNQIQNFPSRDNIYSCDICRCVSGCYEYMYHCDMDHSGEHGHDFCLSCIHALKTQYYEIKPFLMKLLSDILDSNCINEIVTYCVGTVIKFDVSNVGNNNNNDIEEDIDMIYNDDRNTEIVIDETPSVGSKRCLKIENLSRKKRRLK